LFNSLRIGLITETITQNRPSSGRGGVKPYWEEVSKASRGGGRQDNFIKAGAEGKQGGKGQFGMEGTCRVSAGNGGQLERPEEDEDGRGEGQVENV